MPVIRDSVNLRAASGTEQMLDGLESRLDTEKIKHIDIGRALRLFNPENVRVFWTHNLPGQMNIPEVSESQILHSAERWKYLDKIVFVSDWQKEQYFNKFSFDADSPSRFRVIRNAIIPLPAHEKPASGPIRLIYYSVPQRGLELLYHAVDRLYKRYNIELVVYSSYEIYGHPDGNIVYQSLLERVQKHPAIRYSKSVPNSKIRQSLEQAHIFAYPSIYQETSCISLVEAMSAGCMCVHPDLAALPETSQGLTEMYQFQRTLKDHLDVFTQQLEHAICRYLEKGYDGTMIKQAVDTRHSWDTIAKEWQEFINGINNES